MTTIHGKEAWLLRFPDLLHGHIESQDIANGTLTLETDDGQFITLTAEQFAFSRADVLHQIGKAVARLAVLAAQFDQTFARDFAPRKARVSA